jgi:hypothetical protein
VAETMPENIQDWLEMDEGLTGRNWCSNFLYLFSSALLILLNFMAALLIILHFTFILFSNFSGLLGLAFAFFNLDFQLIQMSSPSK